ncbi:MAG: RluA family pseudouridine synthase [Bacteroidota bacterium]
MSRNTPPLEVLYEDNHLIAVNKRPSDIVQGDKTGDTPLGEHVKAYIKDKYQKPGAVFLGVIHRLDRPVSGVVVFARTSKALSRMNALFQKREVQKTYWALVQHAPNASGKLVHFLRKNEAQNKSYASNKEAAGSKRAELSYRVRSHTDRYQLLEVLPHTGRHHQIRVQLAAMGCPIKGDVKYGFSRPNKDGSIHLHARKLEFVHPVSKEAICLLANPPKDPVWDAVKGQ